MYFFFLILAVGTLVVHILKQFLKVPMSIYRQQVADVEHT